MPVHQTAAEAIPALQAELPKIVSGAVRTLLQTKHLYQSVKVEMEGLIESYAVPAGVETRVMKAVVSKVGSWPWVALDVAPNFEAFTAMVAAKSTPQDAIKWGAPDIKVYCPACDRIEAFNPSSAKNLVENAFALTYICQSCKGPPQVFLISKRGYKLTLCGRTPMEHVDVPNSVPKSISKYFSGAEVAHQSGQTLAGLFLLRTLCEQWALEYATEGKFADKAIAAYMEQLPGDFKARFPSIAALYSDLSAALHQANADAKLYDQAIGDIRKHFEARALYGLPAPTPKANGFDVSSAIS